MTPPDEIPPVESLPAVRLFVTAALEGTALVALSADQSHYLGNVMRLNAGDGVRLFNGRDGEWLATVEDLAKRGGSARPVRRLRPQADEPGPWLLFAPIKRARIDQVAEKATELGAALLWPVITQRTVVDRVNLDRLRAHAVEAAEQCGRLTVPEIRAPVPLSRALADWPAGRRLLLFDETGRGAPVAGSLPQKTDTAGDAILIGPEGGFAPSELDGFRKLPFVTPVSMGGRILRSETAVVAALACWQAWCGDWRG